MLKRALISAGFAAVVAISAAHAQTYPQRPVRLIVPFPPGGANDVLGRLIAMRIGQSTGQQFVVDNRGGANSIIGSDLTAKATPDGYTILIVPGSHAINPALYKRLPYDTLGDFAAVSLIGTGAYMLLASTTLPADDVRTVVNLAKAKPGALNFASAGAGNVTHLALELFKKTAGIEVVHVPYKGGGPAVMDLIAGHVSLYFATVALAGPMVRAGKVKALGVSTSKRTAAFPNVPTIAESGVPGFQVSGWYGLLAPAKTPDAIVRKLNAETAKALHVPEVKDKLVNALGIDPVAGSPDELNALIRADMAKWRKVVAELGIKVDR